MIDDKIRKRDLSGGKKMTPGAAGAGHGGAGDAGHPRRQAAARSVLKAVGTPSDPQLQAALKQAAGSGRPTGSHRRDLDQDGVYEHNARRRDHGRLVAANWCAAAVPAGAGNRARTTRIQAMIGLGAAVGRRPARPASPTAGGATSTRTCGRCSRRRTSRAPTPGSSAATARSECRQDLQESLRAALTVTPQEMYGFGACERRPAAVVLRQEPATGDRGDQQAGCLPVPEPADVPAGGQRGSLRPTVTGEVGNKALRDAVLSRYEPAEFAAQWSLIESGEQPLAGMRVLNAFPVFTEHPHPLLGTAGSGRRRHRRAAGRHPGGPCGARGAA